MAQAKKKTKKKAVIKSSAVEKAIASSLENLTMALESTEKAIKERSATAKKLTSESKRLSKKRAILTRRKKTAKVKLTKTPDAANRKALKDVEKEIAVITKQITKSTPVKQENTSELASLKASHRQASAYVKGIQQADKVLAKPKKKRRKKRVVKA